jgi:non-ribosomal peptide synthetase component F
MAAKIYQVGARIAFKDVADLNAASEALAVVADQVKRANPGWGPPVIQLLIQANTTIVRIQTKGARAFAAWYEKHGVKPPGSDPDDLNSSDSNNLERNTTQEEKP